MAPVYLKTPASYAALLERYDTFLFDLDGVIWNGNVLTPRIAETLARLRFSKRIAFLSNNSTLSRAAYVSKFASFGIPVVREEVITCGSASATFLKNVVLPLLPEGKKGIYLVGQAGLETELDEAGLEWKGGSVRLQLREFPNPLTPLRTQRTMCCSRIKTSRASSRILQSEWSCFPSTCTVRRLRGGYVD